MSLFSAALFIFLSAAARARIISPYVGTVSQANTTFGLVQTQDGLLHKVRPGNYIGQYDGRVVAVTPSEIQIEELVPDGIGGFYKRSATIALNN